MPAMATSEMVPSKRIKMFSLEPKTKGTISGAAIRDELDRILESRMCT
jgi:hypothetical protein